jgi:hypothetical protein
VLIFPHSGMLWHVHEQTVAGHAGSHESMSEPASLCWQCSLFHCILALFRAPSLPPVMFPASALGPPLMLPGVLLMPPRTRAQTIANLREALKKSKRMCAIMLDTKGPEIRTGLLKDGKDVELLEGQVCDFG